MSDEEIRENEEIEDNEGNEVIEGNEELQDNEGNEIIEDNEELQDNEGNEEIPEEETENLPFAKAEVVRLMKQNLDSDKMIRERVKVEMNIFLGKILENVCNQLNEYPYTTIEYEMLKESIYPYKNIERINEEKERILKHLDAIKADCDALSLDVRRTLKIKEVEDTVY